MDDRRWTIDDGRRSLGGKLKSSHVPRPTSFVSFCVCVFFLCLSVSGCRPSYTNENLEQSIIDICKKEYKIDVKVKRVGKTIGIYLPVNGIFESNVKVKDRATLEDILSGIKFTKDALDKMDNVSMVLSRAALSTDADVDFYVLIISDTKGSGLQIAITRFVMDMKRLILGDVSRGDYVQRLLMDMDFSPVSGAQETVKDFFYDAQRLSSQKLIARYFSKTTNVRLKSADFFLYLAELDYKQQRRYYVTDIGALEIEKGKVLARCNVKEVYLPAGGYESFRFLSKSGSVNEYLILLDTGYIPYMIEEIIPTKAPYPPEFRQYENPAVWNKENFFLEEVRLPDFLSRQLANRIRELYQTDPRLKTKFVLSLIKGEYLPETRKFKITLDIENKKSRQLKKEHIDFNAIWKIISHVMRRYDFKDYETVELVNIADARREVMARGELLDKFWPEWLLRR